MGHPGRPSAHSCDAKEKRPVWNRPFQLRRLPGLGGSASLFAAGSEGAGTGLAEIDALEQQLEDNGYRVTIMTNTTDAERKKAFEAALEKALAYMNLRPGQPLLGQKIAAVTPKPQTTRKRQLGILTTEKYQLVFADTPGMHFARHKLGDFLNQEAEESLEGMDVILWLVDASVLPTEEDKQIAALLARVSRRTSLVLAANKIDLVPPELVVAADPDGSRALSTKCRQAQFPMRHCMRGPG